MIASLQTIRQPCRLWRLFKRQIRVFLALGGVRQFAVHLPRADFHLFNRFNNRLRLSSELIERALELAEFGLNRDKNAPDFRTFFLNRQGLESGSIRAQRARKGGWAHNVNVIIPIEALRRARALPRTVPPKE